MADVTAQTASAANHVKVIRDIPLPPLAETLPRVAGPNPHARPLLYTTPDTPCAKEPANPGAPWQRFLAWDDFLRLGRSAGVYPRRILAGAAGNGRRA